MKDRRDFLKLGLYSTASMLMPSSIFADSSNIDDYKAIVVVYQAGGNDGLNMFVPSSDDSKSGYSNYANIRDTLRVKDVALDLSLSNNELDLSAGNPYALNNSLEESYTKGLYYHENLDVATNALMPEIADLVNKNNVAILANCGNLIQPATKAEFLAKTKQLPPFLYAHNHQTKLMMNAEASILDYSGWAGRLYDNWLDINNGNIYGLNIGIDGSEHLFYGDKTTPLIINHNGPTSYYKIKRDLYDRLLDLDRVNKFRDIYNKMKQHSFNMQDIIVDDWENNAPNWESTNAYGGELFSMPSDSQLSQQSPTFASDEMLFTFLNQFTFSIFAPIRTEGFKKFRMSL